MSENLYTALLLLIVGMITVFSILFLVVQTGRILIYLVNRFSSNAAITHEPTPRLISKAIHPKKLAAIVATVELVTQGKGQIQNIEKRK